MRKISKVVVAIMVLAVAAWAGDVWKDKPYNQWDEKDIAKILRDSPWSRQASVDATWRSGQQAEASDAPQPANPSGGGGGGSKGGYGGYGGASRPESGGSASGASAGGPAQVTFRAIWQSSKTVQEALVRQQVLKGTMKQEDAEKLLAQEVPAYMIGVLGQDMTPFAGAEEQSLKEATYLEFKKSKQKIAPDQVQIQRDADGKNIISVNFRFPKKTTGGEATIPAGEKSVEFVTRAGKTSFKFGFDLQKMVGKQGQDL